MNENEVTTYTCDKVRFCFSSIFAKGKRLHSKIVASRSSYLAYCFIIPVVLMLIVYLTMELYPIGNGTVLVLDLNGQYVYFFEALRGFIYGENNLLYSFSRALGGEFFGIYAYYLASPLSYLVALFPQNAIQEAILCINSVSRNRVLLVLVCNASCYSCCLNESLTLSQPAKVDL